MIEWLRERKRARQEARAEEAAVLQQHHELISRLIDDWDPTDIQPEVRSLVHRYPHLQRKLQANAETAALQYVEKALADEVLTLDEERRLELTMDAAGMTLQEICDKYRDTFVRLVVSQVNDGRLPTGEVPVILKKDEIGHQVMEAHLLKEVAVREYRGGYSGMSFKIAKGVRYHTGGTRGRSEIVGYETKIDDSGQLAITSHRAVFIGGKKNIEFAYPKLVSVDVDGEVLRLHCSNRKNTPALFVGSGHIAGAIITAAAQRLL